MARLFLGGICGLFIGQQAMAERMVADLSRHVIDITSRFTGTQLLIFGAIERKIIQKGRGYGTAVKGSDYDVIVVVQSKRRNIIIRRKEKLGPIWANRESLTLENVPGFYALASTGPIKSILSQQQLSRIGVGFGQLKMTFKQQTSPAEAAAFRQGFIRNMRAKKLYSQPQGTISILDGLLFRAILDFPANMPVGNYRVDIYLVRDGKVVLAEQSPLEVNKAGLERFIYNFAHGYPAFYGMAAVLMALVAGLLGGFMSRKMSA